MINGITIKSRLESVREKSRCAGHAVGDKAYLSAIVSEAEAIVREIDQARQYEAAIARR